MAAIVTKIGAQGFGRSQRVTARKSRVARVSAKAVRRASKPKQEEPEPENESDRDSDNDETMEADESTTATTATSKKPRNDSGTYLSMYFRDMAALDVLRPEEEFTSAREIEALEIMLWEAVLAHPPAVEHVLAAVEPVIAGTGGDDNQLPPEAKTLRNAAAHPE